MDQVVVVIMDALESESEDVDLSSLAIQYVPAGILVLVPR